LTHTDLGSSSSSSSLAIPQVYLDYLDTEIIIPTMASKSSKNRNSLACKFCLRIQENLPVHLRRSCRKGAKTEEIDRLVSEAREHMRNILKGLSVVNYRDLDYKNSNPRDFFVQFLEKNGCYVRGKPVQASRY
ncbi:hypothetical protein XELAEV_18002673mg, partial [Xenopus laevis]